MKTKNWRKEDRALILRSILKATEWKLSHLSPQLPTMISRKRKRKNTKNNNKIPKNNKEKVQPSTKRMKMAMMTHRMSLLKNTKKKFQWLIPRNSKEVQQSRKRREMLQLKVFLAVRINLKNLVSVKSCLILQPSVSLSSCWFYCSLCLCLIPNSSMILLQAINSKPNFWLPSMILMRPWLRKEFLESVMSILNSFRHPLLCILEWLMITILSLLKRMLRLIL